MQHSKSTPENNIAETESAYATRRHGEAFAALLKRGDLVCLRGDLGAGKTTWTQGVARALGIECDVSSPTFVLMNEHFGRETLLHLDAYRLEEDGEDFEIVLRDAGIFDFLTRDDAIKIVEWPSRIERFLPSSRLEVRIENLDENRRRITTSTRSSSSTQL